MANVNVDQVSISPPTRPSLTKSQRFAIGGMGGLLPVLASLVTIDLAIISTMIDNQTFTYGLCIGFFIRVVSLFVLGGVIAALNSEVVNPLALVQIGIAAPALVTSYLSGAALVKAVPPASTPAIVDTGTTERSGLSTWLFTRAYAADSTTTQYKVAGGFIGDIVNGTIPGFGRIERDIGKQNDFIVKDSWPTIDQLGGGEGGQSSSTNVPKLTPVFGPAMEIQPGIVNFIVINNQLQNCIPMAAPGYVLSQLQASFPSPSFTISTGVCVPATAN